MQAFQVLLQTKSPSTKAQEQASDVIRHMIPHDVLNSSSAVSIPYAKLAKFRPCEVTVGHDYQVISWYISCCKHSLVHPSMCMDVSRRGGEEVGRHVGSSRGDLIGQILQQQALAGVALPSPAGTTAAPRVRRKMVRRV